MFVEGDSRQFDASRTLAKFMGVKFKKVILFISGTGVSSKEKMTFVVMEIYVGDGNKDGGEKLPRWLLFLK